MAVLGAFPPGIGCRPFDERDWGGVADCLHRGFPERSRSYWIEALTRLAQRPAVVDFPRYGFVLEKSGRIVGAVLTLARRVGLSFADLRLRRSGVAACAEAAPDIAWARVVLPGRLLPIPRGSGQVRRGRGPLSPAARTAALPRRCDGPGSRSVRQVFSEQGDQVFQGSEIAFSGRPDVHRNGAVRFLNEIVKPVWSPADPKSVRRFGSCRHAPACSQRDAHEQQTEGEGKRGVESLLL